MKFIVSLSALLMMLTACQSQQKSSEAKAIPLPVSIDDAVASAYRSPENTKRDIYRHPAETLQFFGLKDDMTVIEISPGGGWYMEILAPYLVTKGQYIAAIAPAKNDHYARYNEKVLAWIASHPVLQDKVKTVSFEPDMPIEGEADMVLTFRNVHSWVGKGSDQAAFHAFFKALKPGGVLGVVEHRAHPKSKRDPKAKSGYMREADVIALATKAGFKLDAKSEINANPKDTRNHPSGVWTLPPSLRLGDKDREKYLAIGESDRMTLRFVKPLK